ncbi:fimbrial protein [Enterobacter cloacae complex sp. ECC445]|uniref:fimbrial-like protein n=1 Tax=Enterobacter cloacae complex sp. ECC445 TaxID=2913213 RepID=UPI001F0212E7|nr:fimbrial-like protein [Enterobacter cloacae complex sp. ECC445]MCG0458905.1 fimbrial protein [Enterobacter cloacae complex sp. ECC445]
MQQSPILFSQPGLVLLVGLAGGLLPGVCQASSGLDVNMTANIVNSTCQVSVNNGGNVYLPTVTRSWFYNSDNTTRLAPTDYVSGTPFTVSVTDCHTGGEDTSGIRQLHFSFSPQNGFWSGQNQVFKNDATTGAAQNVGLVIFSAKYNTNVLKSDGSSDVAYDIAENGNVLTDYEFSVRYQNTGAVAGGSVTSNVLVDVRYE